jgi:hypothetical protein
MDEVANPGINPYIEDNNMDNEPKKNNEIV